MKKQLAIIALASSFVMPSMANALDFDITDIINIVGKIYGVNTKILDQAKDASEVGKNSLDQLKDVRSGLLGTHDFGQNSYDPNLLEWGQGSKDWSSILAQAKAQHGGGEIGSHIAQLAKEFPISQSLGSSNDEVNRYYAMQAETNLAARASSEVAFKQINQEAETIGRLHRLIDTTKDAKSAADLNNRMASEQSKVSIQQTKLMAILVQQAAVANQEKSNAAKQTAEFFDIK